MLCEKVCRDHAHAFSMAVSERNVPTMKKGSASTSSEDLVLYI